MSAPITLPVVWGKKPKKHRTPRYTPEEQEKRREAFRKRMADPEMQKKRKEGFARYLASLTPEQKEARAQPMRGKEVVRMARARLAVAEYHADPENREKYSQIMKAMRADPNHPLNTRNVAVMQTPAYKAIHSRKMQLVQAKKRGFIVPDHLRLEYKFLRKTKKIPPREAAKMLGIKVVARQSIVTLEEYKVPKGELGDILHAVSTVTGIPCEDIAGLSRSTRIMRARMVFYYVSKTYCRYSYPKIGEVVNRDHSTVISGCERVRKYTEVFSLTIRKVLELLSRGDKVAA